jgi:hypothetical protein
MHLEICQLSLIGRVPFNVLLSPELYGLVCSHCFVDGLKHTRQCVIALKSTPTSQCMETSQLN